MKRYRITTTKKWKDTGRKSDNVYHTLRAAGPEGASWVDIAATVKDVPSTAVHSYLHALRKEGFVENVEVAVTSKEKEVLAQEKEVRVRDHKWKCPHCAKWVKEPIMRNCRKCREEHGAPTTT